MTSACFWAQAAAGLNNVWLLLGVFSLQQAFFAVNQPTRTAVLPRLLPKEQLPAANALNMTVMTAGAIAGPLVGGALIPVIGLSWLYLIDTLTLGGHPGCGDPAAEAPRRWTHRIARPPLDRRGGAIPALACGGDGRPRAGSGRDAVRHAASALPEIAHASFGEPAEGGGLVYALLFVGIPLGSMLGGLLGWYSRVRRQGYAVIFAIRSGRGDHGLRGGGEPGPGVADDGTGGRDRDAPAIGGAADMASAAFRQTMLLAAVDDAYVAGSRGCSW